jgi:hypothetical protein
MITSIQLIDFLENCTDEEMRRFCEKIVSLADMAVRYQIDEYVQYAGAEVVKTVLRQKVPNEYWHYHHKRCGIDFRGCHPTKCPKDQYERTGIWNPNLAKEGV